MEGGGVRRVIVFGLAIFAVSLGGCAGRVFYPSGPFSGRVIDAETRQPLTGAAVVAVWYREAPGIGHYVEALHDATERTTDEAGRFTIPRTRHAVLAGTVRQPYLVVYYPGYKDFLGQAGDDLFKDDTIAVIHLMKPAPAER